MADVTQRVVIEVDYKSNLGKGIDELEQLGTVAKEDVAAFKGLQKEIQDGMNDALKEAGVSMKQFADASQKATQGDGFKSLKQQMREARDEAQILAQKFGESSKEAINAQKKVASLAEELDDFNQRVKALNPEAKFNAFNNVMQGTIGAFQGVTGAMQLFGSENKELNETLQKMQGLLNLTQGINSLVGLKDAFANLRVVLGLTAVAQETMAAATVAEGAAATGAASANYAFAASLSATGIGAIVVALGVLVGAWVATKEATEDAAEVAERYQRILYKQKIFNDTYSKEYQRQLEEKTSEQEYQLKLAQAQGNTEKEILKLQIQQTQELLKFNREFSAGAQDQSFADQLHADNIELMRDLDILEVKLSRIRDVGTNEKLIESSKEIKQFTLEAIDAEIKLGQQKEVTAEMTAEFFRKEDERNRIERIENLKKYYSQSAALATEALNFAQQQSQASMQAEEAALNDQLKRKEISQKQYDQKLRALKRKQAEDDKKYAVFMALIQSAQAIINALTQPNPIAAVAFASALSALEIASIISRPVPKFAKGTLNVQGGRPNEDSVHALLMPGEAVIPTSINRAYSKTIEAIYKGTVRPSDLNAFVESHKSGKSTGQSMAQSMELLRAVRGNGNVGIRNASELAKMIGQEVRSSFNPRRQW